MRKILPLGLLLLVLLTFGCAADVSDIDRTQPGKLKKSLFEDEWYYRQTVIGVPFTTGVTFIGEQSSMERLRWEISEEHLTAYRSYEKVENSERPSQLPGTEYQGAPIAAFRIQNHFDVQRIYNDTTGEQTNVIVEDSSDRPWYQREYIRVDWSANLVANFDFIAGGSSGVGVRSQSASYTVTDPESPEAPVFGVRDGDSWRDYRDPFEWGELASADYFDITQRLQVTPDVFPIYYDDGTAEYWPSCWFYEYGPWDCASQTIKIRASFLKVQPSDYEPLPYPDNYVARDDNGDAIRTMVGAEGEMRRCESHESEACQAVRIPMFDWFGYFRRERESYDRDYGITESGRIYYADRFNLWQQSFDHAGKAIPYRERRVKKITYHLSETFPLELTAAAMEVGGWWNEAFTATVNSLRQSDDVDLVFEVVPNTYAAKDGKITDFGQRNGDLRYNHLYWVDNPQFESLLGYGPNAPDPLTGEVISADAYIYGAAIDSYASYGAEVIELARGSIHERDFIEGENVGAALARIQNPNRPDPREMRLDVERVMDQGLGDRLTTLKERGREAYRSQVDHTQARLNQADRAGAGDALWNNEMRESLERRFGRRLDLSEFAAGNLARAYHKHRMKLAKARLDFRNFDDLGVLSLIDEFEGLERKEIVKKLRAYLFKSVTAHEIGHTLGLRHNFAGSTDALNYHNEYWDIRDPHAKTLDLPTREELKQGLREYSYSSIMDYGARFNSDIRGIGKYDRAAIKFGYGQLVERFTTPPDWSEHDILRFYNLEDIMANSLTHYTDIPGLFTSGMGAGDGLANMRSRVDIPMSDYIKWKTVEPGYQDLTDSLVPYQFCSDEYQGAVWNCAVWDDGADPYEINNFRIEEYRNYYIFDAFKRNKRYVDPFEHYYSVYYRVMEPMATQYHLWLYEQWDKLGEWEWMHSAETTATEVSNWNLDPHGGLSGTAAAMSAVNFFTEVIGTPEPGSYYTDKDNVLQHWTYQEDVLCRDGQTSMEDSCSDVYIPLGEGRYAYSEFASETGYYWFEKIRVVGSFWEKLAAIEVMSNPTTYFLGVDDIADSTSYNLGFNAAFPHAVSNIFGAVINNDYKMFAHYVDEDGVRKRPNLFAQAGDAEGDAITMAPAGAKFIDPGTNFTMALYTMFYGMALLNSNYDQSFNDDAKIWVSGHGEAVTPTPGSQMVTFSNPFNFREYNAIRSANPESYSLGYEMLERANHLKADVSAVGQECFFSSEGPCEAVANQTWELRNLLENAEVIRGYYDLFGYAWF